MWDVNNATPFAFDRTITVDENGRRQFVVVLKATFDVHPDGSTDIAKAQLLVVPGPEYRGEAGFSSLLYAGELSAPKQRTDLLVNAAGPIPMNWEPRRSLYGTYDAAWVEHRRPLLASDYNRLATQTAPVDQQVTPHLRGGERIGLVGLLSTGNLELVLPTHRFGFQTSTRTRVESKSTPRRSTR